MKISSPEILFICSCALFISHLQLLGFIFLGLGTVGACMRAAIETHANNERLSLRRDIFDSQISMISMFVESLFGAVKSIKIGSVDRDINEDEYN
jgi:hypothetical protein